MPAQLMTMRSGAAAEAASTACCTALSSVTSTGANVPLSSCARAAPAEFGRSAMTTCAPAFASSVAVARPSPLAPPVTIALLPSIRIRCLLCVVRFVDDDQHGTRVDLLARGHADRRDGAGGRRGDGVLHLHRFEY